MSNISDYISILSLILFCFIVFAIAYHDIKNNFVNYHCVATPGFQVRILSLQDTLEHAAQKINFYTKRWKISHRLYKQQRTSNQKGQKKKWGGGGGFGEGGGCSSSCYNSINQLIVSGVMDRKSEIRDYCFVNQTLILQVVFISDQCMLILHYLTNLINDWHDNQSGLIYSTWLI